MREVLVSVAAFDGRTIDVRVIHEWHAVMGAIDAGLALQAVRVWSAENRGFIQPNDVAATAAKLAGLGRQKTVTELRLDGEPFPWERETLAAQWVLPQIERQEK